MSSTADRRSRLDMAWMAFDRVVTVAVLLAVAYFAWSTRSRTPPTPNAVDDMKGTETQLPTKLDGSSRASIALIEFSDFQCPYCAKFEQEVYPRIQNAFVKTDVVRYAFRHLPLPIHALAFEAGEAAECAETEGKFWQMHERLFSHQTSLSHDDLMAHATALQIDSETFQRCLTNSRTSDRVKGDASEGRRLGISGTPSFIVGRIAPDGRTVTDVKRINGGRAYDVFERVINEMRNEGGSDRSRATGHNE